VLELRSRKWVFYREQPPLKYRENVGAAKLDALNAAADIGAAAHLPPGAPGVAIIVPRRGPTYFPGPCRDGTSGAGWASIIHRLAVASSSEMKAWLQHTSLSDLVVPLSGTSKDDLKQMVVDTIEKERRQVPRVRAMTIAVADDARPPPGAPVIPDASEPGLLRRFLLSEERVDDAAGAGSGAPPDGDDGEAAPEPSIADLRELEKKLPSHGKAAARYLHKFPFAPGPNQVPIALLGVPPPPPPPAAVAQAAAAPGNAAAGGASAAGAGGGGSAAGASRSARA
jgi:hypothetical protein